MARYYYVLGDRETEYGAPPYLIYDRMVSSFDEIAICYEVTLANQIVDVLNGVGEWHKKFIET